MLCIRVAHLTWCRVRRLVAAEVPFVLQLALAPREPAPRSKLWLETQARLAPAAAQFFAVEMRRVWSPAVPMALPVARLYLRPEMPLLCPAISRSRRGVRPMAPRVLWR